MIRRIGGRLQGRQAPAPSDVMAGPVAWKAEGSEATATIKVDRAQRIGQALVVAGWTSGPVDIGLRSGGTRLETTCFRTERDDVARYLGLDSGDNLGFVLLAERAPLSPLQFACGAEDTGDLVCYGLQVSSGSPEGEALLQFEPAIDRLREMGVEVSAAGAAAAKGPANAVSWAAGAIDDVRAGPDGALAVASGWFAGVPGARAWIETSGGRRFPVEDAHRAGRPDVKAALSAELAGLGERAGFLLGMDGVAPGEQVRLVAENGGVEKSLAAARCTSWGWDPLAAARWLFKYPTPLSEFASRIPRLDLPILAGMIEARCRAWEQLPVRHESVGPPLDAPRASIIVPLYGRFDFVEHQLLEFARDPWLKSNAEIVYVIDDRELVDRMATDAWTLHALYGVSFSWVWGGANRGFAGANNLGTAYARGRQLVFLNSDAIPLQPGWLQPMLDALEADDAIGAVGPRLLFADGSIQHAGMTFRRRRDLGIWTNHHPRMGLDPSLDPHAGPVDVPSVTGACIAMRRDALERVGGWDVGYLIGDFEDSDLCLKLRDAGMRIVYLPHVQLTHLERQSFKLLGDGDFRTRVVVWNAVRHQERWRSELEASAPQGAEGHC